MDRLVPVKLVRLAEMIERRASRTFETRFGVKNTELRILVILAHADHAVAVSELSRRTRVDKAWISRTVMGLVARGLVERLADPAYPRAPLVALTAKGVDLARQISPVASAHETELLDGLDRGEVERVIDAMLASAERALAGPRV